MIQRFLAYLRWFLVGGSSPIPRVRVLKQGMAQRVIFFYPGEEGTYVDHVHVTLYENGMVFIQSRNEETSTQLGNCEILWRFETEAEDRSGKSKVVRLFHRAGNPPEAPLNQ